VVPRKPPPDPLSDSEWARRPLDGNESPEDGNTRRDIRRLVRKADTLEEWADHRERWAVLRAFARHALITMGIVMTSIVAFKDQLASLIAFLRGSP
jgi:hypothetical protein